jgi:cytochrome c peroxidase
VRKPVISASRAPAGLAVAGLVAAGLALAEPGLDPVAAMFQPLPDLSTEPADPVVAAKIELGKKLYFDTRLSMDGNISCNSCHDLANYGVDNEATSPGDDGTLGTRNSPTVYNAAFHIAQFWDGRAADVEEQALGPIMNPVEMAMADTAVVLERLAADAEYPELFRTAFPDADDPFVFDNVGAAIGAFERTLVTPSRFDAYLRGDASALTEAEVAGMREFAQVGCVACHSGSVLGGQMFQKLGVVKPHPTVDQGRFEVTGNDIDRYFFKVPSMRNVAETGPYLHDGSVKTLEEMIRLMADVQLGQELTDAQVASIATFLKSLTGELPKL